MIDIKYRGFINGKKNIFSLANQGDIFHMFRIDNKFYTFSLEGNLMLIENLTQFTGLKDKNGVEVFDGDIVNNNIITRRIWVDDFHGYRFMFGSYTLCKADVVNGEVIGNVFENPELLGKD